MKALLLAAGFGTRLRPLTDTTPKCLVPIHGEPLLGIWLRSLAAAGCGPFLVNTHYLSEQVESFIEQNPYREQIEVVHEPVLLGTAGTLISNLDFFGDEDGLLIHADNYCLADFEAFIQAHRNRPPHCLMSMMTFRTDNPSSCGIVTLGADNVVMRFEEKQPNPSGNLANGAVYILSAELLAQLRGKESEITDFSMQVLPALIGKICAWENHGTLIDIGTPETYARANALSEACIGCQRKAVRNLLELGSQPPSNRFYTDADQQCDAHKLTLGQCASCGLVQLVDPMPIDMVRSHYSWISYNEPENHLDTMVDRLIKTLDLDANSRIVGLTYQDDSTLFRFKRLGFENIYRYETTSDLGITDPMAGLETIQSVMTPALAAQLAQRRGLADVLFVRRVLDHAHAPREFLEALKKLVSPNGFIVLETPGCTKFLGACDYTFIWEEHISYFTLATLNRLLTSASLSPVESFAYPSQLEDSLVAITRPIAGNTAEYQPLYPDLDLGSQFAAKFAQIRARVRGDLEKLRQEGKRVVVFGAGHLAAKFLNFFELADLVECVIDDNPNKLGMRMPGSGLIIRSSSILLDEKIDLCLLSLSPESEKGIIAAKHDYLVRGGIFRSIFTQSSIAYIGA
ncbi:MAG: sugar phosphate nucleotidyltransferase [Bordetella sp.]|uniref:sugar phosphate nucleotidyltransferase n=1 Tax=Bordetella sp. TaxID=28081 RepID=UPI003F7BFF36